MLTVFFAKGRTAPEVAQVLEELLGTPSEIVFACESLKGKQMVALRFARTPDDLYKIWQRPDLIRRTITDCPSCSL